MKQEFPPSFSIFNILQENLPHHRVPSQSARHGVTRCDQDANMSSFTGDYLEVQDNCRIFANELKMKHHGCSIYSG